MFDAARKLGKAAAYIEGNVSLIEIGIPPILSLDLNGENGTDDEVFHNSMKHLDVDLLVVHFHGIDDAAHTIGLLSGELPPGSRSSTSIADSSLNFGMAR